MGEPIPDEPIPDPNPAGVCPTCINELPDSLEFHLQHYQGFEWSNTLIKDPDPSGHYEYWYHGPGGSPFVEISLTFCSVWSKTEILVNTSAGSFGGFVDQTNCNCNFTYTDPFGSYIEVAI